jgi:hypothetical protein
MPSKCLALFVRIEYTTEGTHRLHTTANQKNTKRHDQRIVSLSLTLPLSIFRFYPPVVLELDLPAGVHKWALAEQLLELCRDRKRPPLVALIQHVEKIKCPAQRTKTHDGRRSTKVSAKKSSFS